MAGKSFFKITGAKEIERKLKSLAPKIAKKVVRKALKSATKVVKLAVEQEAPVGDTGILSASVKVRTRTKKGKMTATVQIGDKNFAGDTWYAPAVEFGTSKMEPNPFMQRAFDKTEDQVANQLTQDLVRGIENEMKK